jgi:hypothetical protein
LTLARVRLRTVTRQTNVSRREEMPSGRADLSEDEAIVQAQRTSRSWFQRREVKKIRCREQRKWDGECELEPGSHRKLPDWKCGMTKSCGVRFIL